MSYVPPSNPQQYPIIWSPGEYGYFPSVLPFEDDDHIDAPQLARGTTPVVPTGSPFTVTNNDTQKRQQLFYVKTDSNGTIQYKSQLIRSGVAVVTLGYGESFTLTYASTLVGEKLVGTFTVGDDRTPTVIKTQLNNTDAVGSIS